MRNYKLGIWIVLILAISCLKAYPGGIHKTDSLSIKRQTDSVIVTLRQKISQLNITGLVIDDIQYAGEGYFLRNGSKRATRGLPSFYRVAITLHPVPESNIKIDVWLPEKNWNGRFLGSGNGGGGGGMPYDALAQGVKLGYATGSTDMGTFPNANAAAGHPERWADFGYRSTHLMTVVSKAVLKAYYNKPQQHAYFVGCSTGGGQALMEAQRYPNDYNGIIAGAPANNRTHLHINFLRDYLSIRTGHDSLFTKAEVAEISRMVIAAFAGKDGGNATDNFLTDPRLAKFDPAVFFKGKFSDKQIAALKEIYAGPVNLRTGEQIYTSLPPGSENSSLGLMDQQKENLYPTEHYYQQKWAFGADYDFRKFDFDKNMAKLDDMLAPLLNANNPDLNPLKKSGGKLIMFTGTADPIVPFQDAVNYYERVVTKQGSLQNTQSFFRYFLIPGMGHCGGGNGVNQFGQNIGGNAESTSENNVLLALVKWVEEGTAPEKIIASGFNCCAVKGGTRFQRPVYPYPKFPHYVSGDVNSAASYTGVDHKRGLVLKPAEKYLR
jgi:feruloyl esterase